MFRSLKKFAAVSSVVAFARSPQGRQLIAKGQAYLKDPKTQQQISRIKNKFSGPR